MQPQKIFRGLKCLYGDLRFLIRRETDFYQVKPKSAILFLTYRCNSRCKTCTMWKRINKNEIEKELGLDEWKLVVDKLIVENIKIFELFGGNVLLRKKVLIDIMKYLHKKGAIIHLATNQIGLDDEVAQNIVRYANTVYVSTDGVDEYQEKIRGIAHSGEIGKLAIQKLLHYRNLLAHNHNRVRIVCNCTVSKLNINLLESIAQYAVKMGFDEVHFEYLGEFKKADVSRSKIDHITPDPHFIEQDVSMLANREEALKIKKSLKNIRTVFKNESINIVTTNIDLLSIENLYKGTIPHKKCYIERNIVTVDPYGNIVSCPFICNYVYGNVCQKEFDRVWNKERHHFFRQAQNFNKLPMCKSCILGIIYNNGILKSLQRIYFERIRPRLSNVRPKKRCP